MEANQIIANAITKVLGGVKEDNRAVLIDFLCFSIERNAAYLRGEVTECYTPEDNCRAYLEHLTATKKIEGSL